jgi:Carboxypeptidase regulatory-like domain
LSAVDVWLTRPSDGQARIASTKTDGEGLFIMSGVPYSTDVMVHTTADRRVIRTQKLRLTPSGPIVTVSLRLWDAGEIRGRVLDEKGEAVARAEVVASFDEARGFGREPKGTTTTDAEGRFQLQKIPLGHIDVRAWARGFEMAAAKPYLANRADVVLRMKRGKGVEMSVRATGLPKGRSPRDVLVHVEAQRHGGYSHLPPSLSGGRLDARGAWSVAGLPDVRFRVLLEHPDLGFEPRQVSVPATKGPHEIVFRVLPALSVDKKARVVVDPKNDEHAVSVSGKAATAGGRAIRGAVVYLQDQESEGKAMLAYAATGLDGRFQFVGLRATGRTVRVGFIHPQSQSVSNSFVLRAGARKHEVTGIELTGPAPSFVEGVVSFGGKPVPGARVQLRKTSTRGKWVNRPGVEVITDRQGRFRHLDVGPEEYYLEVFVAGGASAQIEGGSPEFGVRRGHKAKYELKLK